MPDIDYDSPEAEGQKPIVLTGDETDIWFDPDQTPGLLGDDEES